MSVYVDDLVDYGWAKGPSCHMFGDTPDEVHVLAKRIGLKREWFQEHRWLPHYDLVERKRVKAVAAGAVEVDLHFVADRIAAVRGHFS